MTRTRTALLLVPALALTACVGTSGGKATDAPSAPTGNNRPSASATTAAPEMSATPSPTPSKNLKFGDTFRYTDGVSVTIATPVAFKPGQYAAMASKSPNYLAFTITVVNGGTDNYDATLFTATVQSGNTEGQQVFDSAGGFGGPPSTKILPGREAVFKLGFGVTTPTDVVMEARAGFKYESTVFTN